jgi:hypothetical protein
LSDTQLFVNQRNLNKKRGKQHLSGNKVSAAYKEIIMGKKLRNGTRPDNVEMASAGEKRGHVNPIDVLVDENKRELEEPPTVVTASEKGRILLEP